MTRVVVAASINNELESKDIAAVQRLRQAGFDVLFYYYLPKVPAEYTMIPSFNEELRDWRTHASKMLDELGNKLDIPKGNRHFVDEVLGPDRVLDEAKEYNADIILTNHKERLQQSNLGRFYDWLAAIFQHKSKKRVPIENVSQYVTRELGQLKVTAKVALDTKAAKLAKEKGKAHRIKRKAA